MVDAPIGRSVSSPTRMAVSRKGQGGPDPLPGRGPVHPAGPDHPGDGHAGDGPDPPDPGPPVRHRPSGGRRRRSTATGAVAARRRRHPARSCTPTALAFDHPATGERMSWTSELPDDLRRQLDGLRPEPGWLARPDAGRPAVPAPGVSGLGLRRPRGRLRASRCRPGPRAPRPRPGAPCARRSPGARPSSAATPGRCRRSRSGGG